MSLWPRKVRKARMASETLPPRSTISSKAASASMFHSQVSSKAMIWELERVPSFSAKRTL